MTIRSKHIPGLGSWNPENRTSRRQFFVTSSGSVISASALLSMGGLIASDQSTEQAEAEQPPVAKIKRIKMGTIGCRDLPRTEDWYTNWLGYSVVERGKISGNLAGS